MLDLTIRQKVGQLMMFGFEGKTPSKDIINLIASHGVGSLILFSRNIGHKEEVKQLTEELQKIAKKAHHPSPLIIATDQENGIVRRLNEGTTEFPGSMLLGAADDEDATYQIAKATAKELNTLGLNMNLAPVLDINNNPYNPIIGVRSFGEEPAAVIKHSRAVIKGFQEEGMIAVGKHFPGHGDTDIDSHLDIPIIKHSLERINGIEFQPFIHAFEQNIDSIMLSHIYFPEIEEKEVVPTSVSSKMVHILRNQLGFTGMIMTDCMEMRAISNTVGTVEGAVKALKAGVDMIMISHSYHLQIETIEAIISAIDKGEIDEKVVDEAVNRVLKLKKKLLSRQTIEPHAVKDVIGGREHKKLARNVYEKGVTLVKNDGILPLQIKEKDKLLVILPERKIYTIVEDLNRPYDLLNYIKGNHFNVITHQISNPPTASEMEEIKKMLPAFNIVIIGTINAHLIEQQTTFVKGILKVGKPVIVIAMRNPYDFGGFPEVNAYLATYEHTEAAIKVAVDIIFGKTIPKGKLPVSIPGYVMKGFGLSFNEEGKDEDEKNN